MKAGLQWIRPDNKYQFLIGYISNYTFNWDVNGTLYSYQFLIGYISNMHLAHLHYVFS